MQLKLPQRALLGAALALLLLIVTPYLIPLDYFIPDIEQVASEQLRAPVQVDSFHLFVLPRPHLSVRGIRVGKHPFLEVHQVLITPRLSSLLSRQRVIEEISLKHVIVGQALLGKASAWASRTGGQSSGAVRVERIEVRDAFVDFAELKMRDVDMDIELNQNGGLARAQVRADTGRFEATLLPHGRSFTVHIAARGWKLPAGLPLLVSELAGSGTLDPGQGLRLGAIRGSLYGGAIAGKLNIGWDTDWIIDANLAINDVEIQPIVALYTEDATISGRLSANAVIAMRAPSAAELAAAVDVESDFRIEQGILHNIDLSNASKAASRPGTESDGQTRFDKVTGHLGIDSAGYYLTNVQIGSGVLTADAEIFISTQQALAGHVDVALKGTSGILSSPLVLSGTVQDPALYPSKAALAGAAAGTMLLGPGLGTTVGLKAGRYTQKLFGRRVKKARANADKALPGAASAERSRGGTVPGGR